MHVTIYVHQYAFSAYYCIITPSEKDKYELKKLHMVKVVQKQMVYSNGHLNNLPIHICNAVH